MSETRKEEKEEKEKKSNETTYFLIMIKDRKNDMRYRNARRTISIPNVG
jgi:hypothetical protein